MNVRIILFFKRLGKSLSAKWYNAMKPLANYLSVRENQKYQKLKDSITEDKAAELFTKDIVKYLIRYNGQKVSFIVAKYFDEEEFSGYRSFKHPSISMIKSRKARTASHKFEWDIDLQLKVIDNLRNTKGVNVEEEKEEFPMWRRIDDYVATYRFWVEK